MTGFALVLVLAAATIHASFNFMAKRAGAADSTAFVWLGTLVSILIAAILGKRLLAEGEAGHRLLGAAAMTIGLICLALG